MLSDKTKEIQVWKQMNHLVLMKVQEKAKNKTELKTCPLQVELKQNSSIEKTSQCLMPSLEILTKVLQYHKEARKEQQDRWALHLLGTTLQSRG